MLDISNLKYLEQFAKTAEENNMIEQEYYDKYDVKRGLRNNNGTGVLVGLTRIGNVHGYSTVDGKIVPSEGKLTYRGMDVVDIVHSCENESRLGFEEACYLLLLGKLPSQVELGEFNKMISNCRSLPTGFTEDMILKAPSRDIMNKLQRSILVSYSYDNNPDDNSIKNVLRQSIELIARMPSMISYAFQAKSHYYDNKSLIIHHPLPNIGTAENILHMIRPDNKYTRTEVEILDLALIIHAEHGGGNNSTFTTHVVSSTGTDTYSAIAAAIGSLKGPKHGGANIKCIEMMHHIKENLKDWKDEGEIESYLTKILNKDAFDKAGLIYGMGHAIYTLSDPRAILLKEKAFKLAKEKNRVDEFELYTKIEEISKKLFERRGIKLSANVDFYSGFVYDMLNIPQELFTPLFAVARIPGWCTHRIEQIVSEKKIIRPAYRNIQETMNYISIKERNNN